MCHKDALGNHFAKGRICEVKLAICFPKTSYYCGLCPEHSSSGEVLQKKGNGRKASRFLWIERLCQTNERGRYFFFRNSNFWMRSPVGLTFRVRSLPSFATWTV